MFTGIKIHPDQNAGKEETAVDMLLGCHQRIRHFAGVIQRIAGSKGASLDEISDASADVHRYFTVSLPLHEADETSSVEPRLQAAVPGSEAARAARVMIQQHVRINALLHQLLPIVDALCRSPELLDRFAPRMTELASEFQSLWDTHLKLEEETVFPAINLLPETERRQMVAEMRERRRSQQSAA